jgi:hypothetical protein
VHRVYGGGRVRRVDAGRRKRQMRVGIYEAGHHYTSGSIDLRSAARLGEILDAPAGSDFDQKSIANEDGAVLYHVDFIERNPRSGPPGAAHCKQMAGTMDQYGSQLIPHLTVTLVLELTVVTLLWPNTRPHLAISE